MSDPHNVLALMSLKGKVALITGATGHLGSAMASALAEAGASVAVSSRKLADAKAVIARLPQNESRHHAIEMDHMDERSIENGFRNAIAAAGRIDVLVANGHDPIASDWRDVSAEQFDRQLKNLTGYFLMSRQLRDHAVARQARASVVLIGSMYGVVGSYPDAYDSIGPASPVAYHALKGGIVQMTRHLAVYWAKDGVRVNCLSPGPFPQEKVPRELVERLKDKSPMRRMGEPHELKGRGYVFLASEASSYMTGQNLLIDGGWTAW